MKIILFTFYKLIKNSLETIKTLTIIKNQFTFNVMYFTIIL